MEDCGRFGRSGALACLPLVLRPLAAARENPVGGAVRNANACDADTDFSVIFTRTRTQETRRPLETEYLAPEA
jgi:hypothetical protein